MDSEILQLHIDSLAVWADTWLMDFAPSKCNTMWVSTKTRNNTPYLYHLKGAALDSVKEVKYSGITIPDVTCKAKSNLGLAEEKPVFLRSKY